MNTVFFRAFEPEDAILIHEWKNDHKFMKDAVGMLRYTSLQEDSEWVIKRMNHDPYNVYWAICLKDNGKMIGYTCLNNIHYVNSSAEGGAIVIGDNGYQDGMAWIETNLFLFYYAFEVLHLNRLWGTYLDTQKTTDFATNLFFLQIEGRLRQAAYKNNCYHDLLYVAILRDEYISHLECGDYEITSILKRCRQLKKGDR